MAILKANLGILVLIIANLSVTICQQACDIVIVGGTLASLGAVLHAPDAYKTCLIEPTSRLGGQLGDQGVWHIDFNWLYQKDYPDRTIAYNPENIHPLIAQICQKCNTGNCWVSRNCFQYSCIQPIIKQKLSSKKNLTIYYDTMVKSVQKQGSRIVSIQIIQRLPIAYQNARQDCRYFSEVVDDWYTRQPSQYYRKVVSRITVNNFIIQASQYGDLLVLSNATYLQGTPSKSTCGQSIVFGVQQIYKNTTISSADQQQLKIQQNTKNNDDNFSIAGYTAEQVWRYRRLVGSGIGIKVNQISLQNWNGPGNDYKGGYLFVDAKNTTYNWKGGLNFTTLKQAELRSLRFHAWFKQLANVSLQIYKNETKTCIGTTRLPYIRDGRRSVGYKGFLIKNSDVTGVYNPNGPLTATVFADRVAIGMYNMDLHSIDNCSYQPFAQNYPLPFFLPLRAFSNQDVDNLIVAGRAMAQQFFASSATRTHTTQLASGAASMIIATHMKSTRIVSIWELINCVDCWPELQTFIRKIIPLQWTINGKKYPDTYTNQINQQVAKQQSFSEQHKSLLKNLQKEQQNIQTKQKQKVQIVIQSSDSIEQQTDCSQICEQ